MKHEEFKLELQRIECNIQAANEVFAAWAVKLMELLETDEDAFMKAMTNSCYISQSKLFIKRYWDSLDELDELADLTEDPKDFQHVCKTRDEYRDARELLEHFESQLQTIEELGS